MQKKIIIISSLILCIILYFYLSPFDSDKKDSLGDFNQIIIVSSLEDRKLLEPIIDEYIFLDTIYTPEPESKYIKTWIKPEEYADYKNYSNIFILSLTNPPDQSLDQVLQDFKNTKEIKRFPAIARNVYSEPQIITFIQKLDSLELRDNLNNIGLTLNSLVNQHVDSLYLYRYSKLDKNIEISNFSLERFNRPLWVDKNFKIIESNNFDSGFLWIGKGNKGMSNSNYQWLMIKEIEIFEQIDGNVSLLNIINNELKELNAHIEIISTHNKYSLIPLDNMNIYKIYTNYNHNLYKTGGPLVIYLIEDLINDKNIIYYGLINAPGQNKLRYIKELETIIINSIF